MKQIGFKNFRKFKDLDAMDFAPITVFVGENNAGKSTVVKGILALSDFMNQLQSIDDSIILMRDEEEDDRKKINQKLLKDIKFYFNTSYLAHIGTFKRAIYNKAENDTITFHTKLEYMDVSLNVKGNRNDDEAISGNIIMVNINLPLYNIDMTFDIEKDKVIVKFNHEPIVGGQYILNKKLQEKREKYYNLLKNDAIYTAEISSNWYPLRGNLIMSFIYLVEAAINATIVSRKHKAMGYWGPCGAPFINCSKEEIGILKNIVKTLSPSEMPEEEVLGRFRFSPMMFKPISKMLDIEYIYAHAVTQTVIYSAKDTNDYLSRTIHEFAPHQKNKSKKEFVIKWMKEFGVGKDFEIKSVGGEAHVVYITNHDGKQVNLADKGMGSIQLMVLLFRLAITLPHRGTRGIYFYNEKVVIIEEPEQNLHPMLQSKLADLLYEINKDYGFRFIIETHSEYLVRRSQVIVANENKRAEKESNTWENPFRVYYFPSDGIPYDMEYAKDGYFEKPFGKGFFNVSSELSLDLDRIDQGVYNDGQD